MPNVQNLRLAFQAWQKRAEEFVLFRWAPLDQRTRGRSAASDASFAAELKRHIEPLLAAVNILRPDRFAEYAGCLARFYGRQPFRAEIVVRRPGPSDPTADDAYVSACRKLLESAINDGVHGLELRYDFKFVSE